MAIRWAVFSDEETGETEIVLHNGDSKRQLQLSISSSTPVTVVCIGADFERKESLLPASSVEQLGKQIEWLMDDKETDQ